MEKRVGDALDAEIEEELAHDSEDSTGALKPREVCFEIEKYVFIYISNLIW